MGRASRRKSEQQVRWAKVREEQNQPQPRINIYRCEYGCHTVTVDVAVGVTPFFIKCRSRSTEARPIAPECLDAGGECKGQATSAMYPKGPRPAWIGEPTHEWYKPDLADIDDQETIDHVKRGGLLLRPRTDAAPINHGESTK